MIGLKCEGKGDNPYGEGEGRWNGNPLATAKETGFRNLATQNRIRQGNFETTRVFNVHKFMAKCVCVWGGWGKKTMKRKKRKKGKSERKKERKKETLSRARKGK
jgi:hypothetical protein